MLLGKYEFRERRCSESHNLLHGVNEILGIGYIFHQIWITLGTGYDQKHLLNNCAFCENRNIEGHTLLRGVNKVSIHSRFLHVMSDFGDIWHKRPAHSLVEPLWVSRKSAQKKSHFSHRRKLNSIFSCTVNSMKFWKQKSALVNSAYVTE
jgi:hemin uptake protein HemP